MPALPLAIATRLSIVAYRRGLRTDSSERCKLVAPQVIGLSEIEEKGADFGTIVVVASLLPSIRVGTGLKTPSRTKPHYFVRTPLRVIFIATPRASFVGSPAFQNVNAVRLVLNDQVSHKRIS
jgi:hypothetical protein